MRTEAGDKISSMLDPELLEVLTERETDILYDRFGRDGGKRKTLTEVGKNFGIGSERVRQIVGRSILKLQRAVDKKKRGLPIGL